MTIPITIALQLDVIANNKVLIPGCEPTSALSSKALSAYLAIKGCGNALVDLSTALAAIPGSTVKLGVNYGRGVRQKWFVLPPVNTDCPCADKVDWYDFLRNLADTDVPVEESYDTCDINGMGYCPSPGFDSVPAPPVNPYKKEGSFPAGTGMLPPIPPWSV